MSTRLAKGGNLSLAEAAPGVGTVAVGLGWTAAPGVELDASALLCDASGRVLSEQHFVFFNNLRTPDGSVRHLGADAADGTTGDRERIEVDLAAVPEAVERIVFAVAIYDARWRRQSFALVPGAHIRVVDPVTATEVLRYDLRGGDAETAMLFGELYRHAGGWKFRAVGQATPPGWPGSPPTSASTSCSPPHRRPHRRRFRRRPSPPHPRPPPSARKHQGVPS